MPLTKTHNNTLKYRSGLRPELDAHLGVFFGIGLAILCQKNHHPVRRLALSYGYAMIKIITLLSILFLAEVVQASPPCGISYRVSEAQKADEEHLLNQVRSSVSRVGNFMEIHLAIPTQAGGLNIGSLMLTLEENGVRNLVVDLLPYYYQDEKKLYVLNVKEGWIPYVYLSVIYNQTEMCGEKKVDSQGTKYNLTKAITRLSN
jgi:hypothetical protein